MINKKKIIRGSGGPPPPPPPPTRTPDTLNSRQFASIQDLLSEGEIEGFATASKAGLTKGTVAYTNASLKDVFLDNTPVLGESASNTNPQEGDFNFSNVQLTTRFGSSNQVHVGGQQQSVQSLVGFSSAPCTVANGGVTRTLPTGKDAVKVTVTFPQLQRTTDKGDLLGSSVTLKISRKENSETSFTEKIRDTITGRTGDSYSKEYRVELSNNYTSAEIKIERVTSDQATGSRTIDAFNVSLIQLIIDDKQTYPDSAYTNLRLDSEQFSNIPKRSFRIRGVKVKIPAENSTLSTTATYTQAALVVTISSTNHKLKTGDKIIFTKTSGAGVNGTFEVASVPSLNSFTFTSTTSQTVSTSNCTYKLKPHVDLQTGRVNYPEGFVFDGTMTSAEWCSCPALILLDLLTTKRYGFGEQIAPDQSTDAKRYQNLDLFSFIAASKYSNELIDDGFGSKEARFSCNVNIQGSREAFDLINDLSGVMRCFPIWSEGSINITQDRPTDPSYLFSLANVTEGGFTYEGSSLKQRHTVVNVAYFNMDSREIDYEVVEDTSAKSKLGIIKKDVKAFATTSRGQAQRLGKAILFSEQQEGEVISFNTSIEAGCIVRPGNVISVNDPVRHGFRRSGRIKSATTAQITIDSTNGLSNFTGSNQRISVILPNGSVETRNILGINNDVITLNTFLSAAPNVNSMWLIQSDAVGESAQTFRVITVEEKDGINFSITALTYIKEKYDNIENNLALPPRNVSLLNQPVSPPSNVQASEITVVINNLAVPKLIISWVTVTGVSQYLVQYRFNSSNWVSEIVFRPDFEIFNTEAGTYEIKVFSFNAALILSATSSDVTFNALGKTAPPSDVQNLTIEPINNKLIRLRWDQSTDADVIHGGKVFVRHSNKTDGSGTFQNSIDLIEALAGNTTEAVVPSLDGEYILKFRDDQGNFCLGETSVILDLPDLVDSQQILSDREDTDSTPFGGTKTNCSVVSGGLQLTDPSANSTATYDFASTLDLGAVFSLDLKRVVQSIGFALGGQTISATYTQSGTTVTITKNNHGRSVADYIDFNATTGNGVDGVFAIATVTTNTFTFTSSSSQTISSSNCTFAFVNTIDQLIPAGELWDDYAPNGNFDGPAVNDVSAALKVRTTQTDPSGSPTYSQFNTFANGTFKGRGFQFRLELKSQNTGHNISIQQLGILASFESRTERSYVSGTGTSTVALSSGTNANGLDVTFAKPFFVGTSNLGGANAFPPSVGITIQNAAQGEYFVIKTDTNGNYLNAAGSIINGQGFNVKILDSNNNPVNKKFTFQAVGYGKGV